MYRSNPNLKNSYAGGGGDIEQGRSSRNLVRGGGGGGGAISSSNNNNFNASRTSNNSGGNNNNNMNMNMNMNSNGMPAGVDRRVHPLQSNNGFHPTGAPGALPLQNFHDSQKLNLDIDTFTSDAEKLSAILKLADVELHKHLLVIEYYGLRKYILLVPTIIMSLTIAILGFVAISNVTTNDVKVHDTTLQEFLTILVSCLGFVVMIFIILIHALDYNSKINFHRGAAQDLEGLCEKVRLYRMERAMDEKAKEENDELKDLFDDDDAGNENEVDSEEDSEDDDDSEDDKPDNIPQDQNALIPHAGDALVAKQQRKVAKQQAKARFKQKKKIERHKAKLQHTLVVQKVRQAREQQDITKDIITFYGYHTELHSIISSCRSDTPAHISKFFVVMENRVELMSLSRLTGVEEESRMRKNQIVRLASNEIYNEISNFTLWPIVAPSVDKTIESALKRVGQLLNMNYRAQRRCKLIPCCPYIPLCCKKRTTNNVFSIINEGIDQRELDMMQAERVELIRMENDRRARRNAGPEEITNISDKRVSGLVDNRRRGGRNNNNARRRGRGGHGSGRSRGGDGDGDTYAGMRTEASGNTYMSRRSYGGGSRGSYGSRRGGGRRRGRGGMYDQYQIEDDVRTEQDGEEGTYYTEERSRYSQDRSRYSEGPMSRISEGPRSRFSEEERSRYTNEEEMARDNLEYTDDEGTGTDTGTDGEGTAGKKKKKKKKSKKKKKKKDKKKDKKEGAVNEVAAEGEVYDEMYDDEMKYDEYGEEQGFEGYPEEGYPEEGGEYYDEEGGEYYDEGFDDDPDAQYVHAEDHEEVSEMASEYSEMEE